MEDMNVDLLFHHGGKWTLKPHLLYDERYVHSLRAFNSNHLNLIDIKEVFENNLGFVLVKQSMGPTPSRSDDYGLVDPTSMREKRLRYDDVGVSPFAILVSLDGKGPGYKLKTFKQEHNCEEALHNPRATTNTLSHYFKSKVRNNPKRFLDEYNRLEAYANEIRMTNPDSDVAINLSKDEWYKKKKISRNGQCKGQLLVAMAQDCDNSFYPLAWSEDKEITTIWTWFLQLVEKSLNQEWVIASHLCPTYARSWRLIGIPCPSCHQGIGYKNIEPRDEISWWYTKEAYLKTYEAKSAMSNQKSSRVVSLKKSELRFTCSKCGSQAYNARSCKKDLKVTYLALRQRQYEPFGPTRELESDPAFKASGVSEPLICLTHPLKVTWKGKEVMTSNHWKVAKRRSGKSRPRKQMGDPKFRLS
ncbi:hypothetical protein H5410_008834 [Solanum commersonii]|uniref:Uncharacterized protein n=1 Tax=Solanum commersonii TaxID=4109 RepID=A0A9J6AGB4_SOLCO|nr:hypothetical protein H5410_008834 [Solanum commersonii]